jgi:hypothetical protein
MSTQTALRVYSFTFTLDFVGERSDERLDTVVGALLKQGCHDATVSSRGDVVSVGFDREAESFGAAVGSALDAVGRAGYKVVRMEIDPD